MGRKPLKPDEGASTVGVVLCDSTLDWLDRVRGMQSRSAYLRDVVERARTADQEARKALDALLAGEW